MTLALAGGGGSSARRGTVGRPARSCELAQDLVDNDGLADSKSRDGKNCSQNVETNFFDAC